jgi:Peptidase family M23
LSPRRRITWRGPSISRIAGAALALVALLAIVAPERAAAGVRYTPVTQSVASTPRWYQADDGRFHLSYELELTNAVSVQFNVKSVEVRAVGGGRVARLDGARLTAAMNLVGAPGTPTTTLLASTVGVVWIDLTFPSRRAIPARLEHRVTIDLGPGLALGPIVTSTGGRATVSRTGPTSVAPPLAGGRWALVVGAHRRSLQPVNGALRLGQRFAIDFSARLDSSGRTHLGSSSRNASYFNYGQPVLAVADATVVAAVDRYPNQIPNATVPAPLAQADGNHVVLKLGPGVYAGYAHLLPGSVRVRKGQRVRTGQLLGRLGNSGNSSGPHLHFQLMTGPSLLDADGLPFTVDRFRLDGHVPSLDTLIETDREGTPMPVARAGAGARRGVGFTDLGVVTFADG